MDDEEQMIALIIMILSFSFVGMIHPMDIPQTVGGESNKPEHEMLQFFKVIADKMPQPESK